MAATANRATRRRGSPTPTPLVDGIVNRTAATPGLTNEAVRERIAQLAAEQAATAKAREAAPKHVFGAAMGDVTLAGATYALARLTTAGILDLQAKLGANAIPAIDGPTIGDSFVNAAFLAGGQFAPLVSLFRMMLAEPESLPDDFYFAATPEEMVAAINLFFEQSGLSWLQTLVKTYGGRATQATIRFVESTIDNALTRTNATDSLAGTAADSQ
jgi:hypothetical protein